MAELRGALETARAIARGETSARAELDAAIARIEERDGTINAVVVRDFDRARAAADAADARIAAGESAPLLGVPMTIKEAFDLEGLPTTWGFEGHRDHIAKADAVVAQRLKAAGAIILGKTNVPIALADWQSVNPIYGRTLNPHDPARTPGGSSGGSAAALASGMVPLEFGSDIAGSIRVPAHFCGVWGHKPSYGLVSTDGHYFPGTDGAATVMVVAGPMARSPEDLMAALELTADYPPPPSRVSAMQGVRILVLAGYPGVRVDPVILKAIDSVTEACAAKGAVISRKAALPDLEAMHRDYIRLLQITLARGTAPPGRDPTTLVQWFDLLDRQARCQRAWGRLFDDFDVIFAPAAGITAFPHDDAEVRDRTITIDGEPTPFGPQFAWAGLASYTGLPSTAVPIGATAQGLPIGMQILADLYQDRTAITVAQLAADALAAA